MPGSGRYDRWRRVMGKSDPISRQVLAVDSNRCVFAQVQKAHRQGGRRRGRLAWVKRREEGATAVC
jgi:hypothetical protein